MSYKKLFNVFLILIFSFSVFGQKKADKEPEIGVVEHLNEYIPEDIILISETSDTVTLRSLIDKPTVLNLVYFRCPGICSPLMDGIAEVIDKSDMVLGQDYQVLTISFDPREGINLAIKKKKNYLGLMEKKEEAKAGWNFFVSDSGSIAKVTNAVGFKYKMVGNDYLHAASLSILSPDGKIVRYLNGIYFLPFEWKMAIIEASEGKSGPTINKVLQFCYSYDPVGQSYVLNITKVFGALIIFFGLILFIILIVKKPKN